MVAGLVVADITFSPVQPLVFLSIIFSASRYLPFRIIL